MERVILGGRGVGKRLMLGIAQNNPGALQFCCELMSEFPEKGIDYINTLGIIDLKGSRAYQLWNDCCDRDTRKAAGVLQAYLDGKISAEEIHEHTDLPRGTAFDLEEIQERSTKKPEEGYLKARHGMSILGKTPEGTCPECGSIHDQKLPHNQQSLVYQYKFYDEHGRWPTWADAMAHCDEEMQQYWRTELEKRGIKVDAEQNR